MNILLERKWRLSGYTIGQLFVNGIYQCDTLEDRDRLHFGEEKVYGETAIPAGTYNINMKTPSARFGAKEPYKSLCKGCPPRLENVPQFDGVLIHVGNTPKDTHGCILVGQNKVKGQVINSKVAFTQLYNKMRVASDRKESITITIR